LHTRRLLLLAEPYDSDKGIGIATLLKEYPKMSTDSHVRQQLVNLLTLPQAHMTFDHAIQDFPLEHINTRPPNVEYTFWHLLEHLRICQWDILDYCRNPDYQELTFPDDL
jgi:hypothetical protein